ncbi:hypothetical protein NDU88_003869 [Pleurodeles waltl]|uniref:Uncharacterized protein n=1 Tax=Pleurodeles waltl TaxID=8319 RepID=A0AAV7M8D2_PLEWA|nr:hypothetical protein NDU88_003869 [Pleurodeles waltl]
MPHADCLDADNASGLLGLEPLPRWPRLLDDSVVVWAAPRGGAAGGEEATRPRKLNLLAIHRKAQSREQRQLLQPGLNTEAGAPFPLHYGPPARAVTEPLRREQTRCRRRRICGVRVRPDQLLRRVLR